MEPQTKHGRERWLASLAAAVAFGVVVAALYASSSISGLSLRSLQAQGAAFIRAPQQEAQEDQNPEDTELPPSEVEKYINVYRAMQRDHSLDIEHAASRQGLTLQAFREIESKVERDDMVREHVRQALASPASDSSTPNPTPVR
ncbi:MAG: hypothetical protein ABSD31_01775 [Candidatus Binataceae bacterium]|jgi:hypothetical protein